MTAVPLTDKPLNLGILLDECQAAGLPVTALGTDGAFLVTYDAEGAPQDPPDGTQAVYDAHTAGEEDVAAHAADEATVEEAWGNVAAMLALIDTQRAHMDQLILETQANPTLNGLTGIVRNICQDYRRFLGEQRRYIKAYDAELSLRVGGATPAAPPPVP